MESNNNNINDGVFALLTDKFGDDVPSDVVFDVCTKFNWKCKLVFYFVNLLKCQLIFRFQWKTASTIYYD